MDNTTTNKTWNVPLYVSILTALSLVPLILLFLAETAANTLSDLCHKAIETITDRVLTLRQETRA